MNCRAYFSICPVHSGKYFLPGDIPPDPIPENLANIETEDWHTHCILREKPRSLSIGSEQNVHYAVPERPVQRHHVSPVHPVKGQERHA
jgi:hypothetical protein